jgi:phospholipid/cholesterol/gamma-HCH transport system ATP-binding protein
LGAVIKLRDVHFTNVDYKVLDDVNIDIDKGSFTVVTGISGAGKSTLLKLMSGILTPESGEVLILNKDFEHLEDEELKNIKKRIGFMFEDAALLSNLSIVENLKLGLEFHHCYISKQEMQRMIESYLSEVNLLVSINERPAQLSIGEQKLVSFVRAMLLEPEILFLDDPLSSIDASYSGKIIRMALEYHRKKRCTLIIATNFDSGLLRICDKIIMIENKKIRLHDTRENVLKMKADKRPKLINDILSVKSEHKDKSVK